MRAYKCDRCGKFFERYDGQGTGKFFNVTRMLMSGSGLDLCPNCNAELQVWVANGKDDDEEEVEVKV